jgi:hypothetical protein
VEPSEYKVEKAEATDKQCEPSEEKILTVSVNYHLEMIFWREMFAYIELSDTVSHSKSNSVERNALSSLRP